MKNIFPCIRSSVEQLGRTYQMPAVIPMAKDPAKKEGSHWLHSPHSFRCCLAKMKKVSIL